MEEKGEDNLKKGEKKKGSIKVVFITKNVM